MILLYLFVICTFVGYAIVFKNKLIYAENSFRRIALRIE